MLSTRIGRCVTAVQRRESATNIISLCAESSQLGGRRTVIEGATLGPSCSQRRSLFQATTDGVVARRHAERADLRWTRAQRCHRVAFSTTSNISAAVESPPEPSANASRTTAAPEVESSLDSLLPDSLFDPPPSPSTGAPSNAQDSTASSRQSPSISRSLARTMVSLVLQQLRSGLDTTTRKEAQDKQQSVDEAVREAAQQAGVSAEALHQFTIEFMKSSRDPRRMPIASRLFVAAFGVDPLSLVDPTVPTEATARTFPPPSQLLAGADAWGVNAAGYNWASMVLSGQASPPPGLHLLQRGTDEARELLKEQQAAAIRVYATLAMRGDAQGMLGMGRILLASMHRSESTASTDEATKAKQALDVETTRKRVVALWTRAAEKGVADAWFELGILSLGAQEAGGEKGKEAAKAAEGYFEKGAKEGSSQCHHALGVMHTQRAMQSGPEPPSSSSSSSSPTPSTPSARQESLEKSMGHFRKAAELGDGQSAHHVAMRYLLREEMVEETSLGSESDGRSPQDVHKQAVHRHVSLWGTAPDDGLARHWFSKGADAGFMPAMMNLAGMLYESRGQTEQHHTNAEAVQDARLRDLRKAESLYARVSAQASVLSQQQQQQQAGSPTSAQGGMDATAEMASFAQQALGTVQEAIKQLVAK